MDILKEIKKFNPEKELERIKKSNNSKYNIIESIYNFLLRSLNKDFYLNDNFKAFYLEQFHDNFVEILGLHCEISNQCKEIEKVYKEITIKYIDELPETEIIKMCEFCIKANDLNLQTLKKLTRLSTINKDTIIFMNKYLIDINFMHYCNQEISSIPLYAKSINELYKISKEYNMKIVSKLKPVLNRAKACKNNDYAFILVSQDELEGLKGYNFILREPINFPIWEIDHFKDMTFNNGKGEGVFKDFTPFA